MKNKKEVIVISLGGSLIIPDEINLGFLKNFKKTILRQSKRYKFIIVCGGGSIARKYINALKKAGMNEKLQSLSGISATRMNARFMTYFFGDDSLRGIPHKMDEIKSYLAEKNIVFCGALEYHPDQTSDTTSAEVAKHFNSEFINITNVQGLYNKDPQKHKNAKLIPSISWSEFEKMASKIPFKPGQHFVLDQKASKIIKNNRIRTYIIGSDTRELENLLNRKKFKGTIIEG